MPRLVIVSNRLADPRKPAAGGLAVVLGEALKKTGGLWLGWSGNIVKGGTPGEGNLHMHQAGDVTLAELDLCEEDHNAYYRGYANGVLWPVFHFRLDLAHLESGYLDGYRRVNQLFARKLIPLLQPNDLIWIHDYHLIPLAAELRTMGCCNRIGFFLHIPLPPQQILAAIPSHEWLMRALFAYDLIGFQSNADLLNFTHYVKAEATAETIGAGQFRAFNRTVRAGAFPVGIDVNAFRHLGQARAARETFESTRDTYSRRRLLIGVDRLDYSKGLPQRIRAFGELLRAYPENRHRATLLQVVSPSREDIHAYADIRHELEGLCGAINGNYGDLDWMPVRYLHRTVTRRRLPGLYRACDVALVTPLRDGMNLVAKEFVAAQDEANPNVLVLSRFAGAAEQLKEALLVNPYDIQGTAQAIQRALHMPLEERQSRHAALLSHICKYDVHWWCEQFLQSLTHAR